MKNKYIKVTIVLVVLLTFYSIGVFIAASRNKKVTPEEPEKPTVDPGVETPTDKEIGKYNFVLNDNTIISWNSYWYVNKSFNVNNKEFDVYANNERIATKPNDQYFMTYSDDWHIFDSNKNFIDYEGEIIGVYADDPYEIRKYIKQDLTDNDRTIIEAYLNSKGVTYNYDSLGKSKIVYDMNGDGVRDEVYTVSNAFTETPEAFNSTFSFIFIKYYNKTTDIYSDVDSIDNNYLVCYPSLKSIFNIEGKDYYLVGCEYFSNSNMDYTVYSIDSASVLEQLKTSE